jgi:hypothetical protein
VARAFAAVFKRDLILPFADPMVGDMPAYALSWKHYKFTLATHYQLVIDDLATDMAKAVAQLARDLYRYRALYHSGMEHSVTCRVGHVVIASLTFERMRAEDGDNVRIEAHVADAGALSAVKRLQRALDGLPNKALELSSMSSISDYSTDPLLRKLAAYTDLGSFFANLLLGVSPWLTVELDRITTVYASEAGGGHVSMATHGRLVKDPRDSATSSEPNSESAADDMSDYDDADSTFYEMDALAARFARLALSRK